MTYDKANDPNVRELTFSKWNGDDALFFDKPGASIRWCFGSREWEIVVPYNKDGKEILISLGIDDVDWMVRRFFATSGIDVR